MAAYRLSIPGMVCGSAVDSIERTLWNVTGVCGVEAETHEHAVRVEVERDAGAAELIRAVERAGFQVTACAESKAVHLMRYA